MIVGILLDDRYQPDPQGVLRRGRYTDFPVGLRYIHLTPRPNGSGPTFSQVAVTSYADESARLLTTKLDSKRYESGHRIELLAYYEDDFTPNDAKIYELGLLVADLIGTSQFARVWLFSRPLGRVLAVWRR